MSQGQDDESDLRHVGRYVMQATPFGRGGMATVHLARAIGAHGFSRCVVVKKLHGALCGDQNFVDMFVDEARIAARIRHPNVVTTLDIVQLERQHELFIVLDYVHGETLTRLASAGPIPVNIAVSVMVGTLRGLHAAHEAKGEDGTPLSIIHRDVTPHNILVDTDGVTRVVDFGVAKALGRLHSTQGHEIKGKISYMAPEQLEGGTLTRQVDVFQASIVLWELLAGKRLFVGDGEVETLSKILRCNVEPPSVHRAEVPSSLDGIVMRGLARLPSHRYTTALELAEALEAACPLAPASVVGRWVMATAEDSLGQRGERVAQLEAKQLPSAWLTDSSSSPRLPAVAEGAIGRPSETGITVIQDPQPASPRTRSRRSPWVVGASVAGLLVAGGALWLRLGANQPSVSTSAEPLASVPSTLASVPSTLASVPSTSTSGAAPTAAASLAPPSAPPVASTTVAGGAPMPPPRGRPSTTSAPAIPLGPTTRNTGPSTTPPPPTPTATTAATAASCAVPFTIDAQGRKIYRPECF